MIIVQQRGHSLIYPGKLWHQTHTHCEDCLQEPQALHEKPNLPKPIDIAKIAYKKHNYSTRNPSSNVMVSETNGTSNEKVAGVYESKSQENL